MLKHARSLRSSALTSSREPVPSKTPRTGEVGDCGNSNSMKSLELSCGKKFVVANDVASGTGVSLDAVFSGEDGSSHECDVGVSDKTSTLTMSERKSKASSSMYREGCLSRSPGLCNCCSRLRRYGWVSNVTDALSGSDVRWRQSDSGKMGKLSSRSIRMRDDCLVSENDGSILC